MLPPLPINKTRRSIGTYTSASYNKRLLAADGRLFVTTVNGGGIDVLWPDGRYDQFIKAGVIPTNVVFGGATLYMTDAGVLADSADASFGGQLWRIDSDVAGLATSYGRIG